MTETAIMALVIFLVWFIFGWAYLSECDRLEDEETDEEFIPHLFLYYLENWLDWMKFGSAG